MGHLKVLLILAVFSFALTACFPLPGSHVIFVDPNVYDANGKKIDGCLIKLYTENKYTRGEYRQGDKRFFDSGEILGLRTSPYVEKYYFVVNCKSYPIEYRSSIFEGSEPYGTDDKPVKLSIIMNSEKKSDIEK